VLGRGEIRVNTNTGITPFEEGELHWYFGLGLPSVPGTASTFGAMCSRLAMKNEKTKELPSEDASWTEMVAVGSGASGGTANDVEDEMIAYIDSQRRAHAVRGALMRLTAMEYGALQARYGGPTQDPRLVAWFGDLAGVAALTEAAYEIRLERAAADTHASAGDALAELTVAAKDKRARNATREATRSRLEGVRREARLLSERAVTAYVAARRASR
jgi:hypothetical protein